MKGSLRVIGLLLFLAIAAVNAVEIKLVWRNPFCRRFQRANSSRIKKIAKNALECTARKPGAVQQTPLY